jgi:putative restriction endonuclease
MPRSASGAIVTNGLGMCRIHHSAYDADILGIDPDAPAHIWSDILSEIDRPILKHGLQAVHDTKIVLPRSSELLRNRDFLAGRFDPCRAA